MKSEKNMSYPEARRFVSTANNSPVKIVYASVAKRVFNSVETETMLTSIEDIGKPTRLTESKRKNITPSHKTSSSSQTAKISIPYACSTQQKCQQ